MILIIAIGIVAFVLFVFGTSVRIVNQWERMVVKRWGQTNPGLVRNPGFRFLVPVMDSGT